MKFSVCVPNYNYEHYIGETLESVLAQSTDFEIRVSDNSSTDKSVEVVNNFRDDRIHLKVNRTNVGFAGNLDKACNDAAGDRLILLSSDDIAEPDALSDYKTICESVGSRADKIILASDHYIIDGNSNRTRIAKRDDRFWSEAHKDEQLSNIVGAPVWRISAKLLLQRSLRYLRTPFLFATTCYSRKLYDDVEGYGGGYLYNPDKAFAWKILALADEVIYIEKPLFGYRVHNQNQDSIQAKSGALKHLLDQYRSTFDTPQAILSKADLSREDLIQAFLEQDIVLRGLKACAIGDRYTAKRHLLFGQATFPREINNAARVTWLKLALALGPLGSLIARYFYAGALARHRNNR